MRLRTSICCLVMFVWAVACGWATEPRFYGIRTSIGSLDEKLISFDADGRRLSITNLPMPFFRLVATNAHLYTTGVQADTHQESVFRRSIDGSGEFEWLAGIRSFLRPIMYLETDGNRDFYMADVPWVFATIGHYDPDGQLLGETTLDVLEDQFKGFDVDINGDIYALKNSGPATIRRYSPAGNFLAEAPVPFSLGWLVSIDEPNRKLYLGNQQGAIGVYDISNQVPEWVASWDIPNMDLLLDLRVDQLTGHVFAAGNSGIFEFDVDGSILLQNVGLGWFTGVAPLPIPQGAGGDFTGDGDLDSVDLDALIRAVNGGSGQLVFDLSGDGVVNRDDVEDWLLTASVQNLPPGQNYRLGDANLDGLVDAQDFAVWNQNKFLRLAAWSKGDFNGDGIIDGQDFIVWNSNRTPSNATAHAVPEPNVYCFAWISLSTILRGKRTTGCVCPPRSHGCSVNH